MRCLGVFGVCVALSIACAVVVSFLALVGVAILIVSVAVTVVVTFGVVLASGFLVGFGVTGAVVGIPLPCWLVYACEFVGNDE